MREEEDKQKQKIMYAAGMHMDDQAPIAGTSSSSNNKGKGNLANGGSGGVEEGGPCLETMRPNGEEGATENTGVVPLDGDGARAEGRASDSPPDGTAAKSSREEKFAGVDQGSDGGEGAGGAGGDGGYAGEKFGLDIENDVRKRVLDLVREV